MLWKNKILALSSVNLLLLWVVRNWAAGIFRTYLPCTRSLVACEFHPSPDTQLDGTLNSKSGPPVQPEVQRPHLERVFPLILGYLTEGPPMASRPHLGQLRSTTASAHFSTTTTEMQTSDNQCEREPAATATPLDQLLSVSVTVLQQARDLVENVLASDEQLTVQSKYLPGSTIGIKGTTFAILQTECSLPPPRKASQTCSRPFCPTRAMHIFATTA